MRGSALLLFILMMMCPGVTAQETVHYFGVNDRIVGSLEEARNYKEVRQRSANLYRIRTYALIDKQWKFTKVEHLRKSRKGIWYIRFRHNTLLPRFYRREFATGEPGVLQFTESKRNTLLREGGSLAQIPLQLEGTVKEYHMNGSVKSESVYESNQLVSNKYFSEDGSLDFENVFFNVDRSPRFLPGDRFLKSYIQHKIVEEKLPVSQIQDEVLIGWVITEKGTIGEVISLKGRVESVNSFFIETISSLPGEWEPAVLNGRKVRYFITMPINFTNAVPNLQNLDYSSGMLFWDY